MFKRRVSVNKGLWGCFDLVVNVLSVEWMNDLEEMFS
jgi:hypothetical protein